VVASAGAKTVDMRETTMEAFIGAIEPQIAQAGA
jgi:hypothetical protein